MFFAVNKANIIEMLSTVDTRVKTAVPGLVQYMYQQIF